jgi:hypothetical protein
MLRVTDAVVLCGCLFFFGAGCTKSDDGESAGTGGKSSAGGTSGGGGKAGSGGSSASGGQSGSGGHSSSGGTSGSGGKGGSGGTSSNGGATGSGGKGSGGTSGSGGTGSGGKSGSGGTGSGGTGSGGSSGTGLTSGGDAGTSVGCTFSQTSSTGKIATVGIIKWSTTLSGMTSAHIDFGPTTSYGMTAPVDSPVSGDNTTWLLGMKQTTTYHYRITASGSSGDCTSDDYTIKTGSLANGLPTITVSNTKASSLYGGFLITAQYVTPSSLKGAPVYILDADGEIVWAYDIGKSTMTCARMSYDGKYMWMNTANVPQGMGTAAVHRVPMDGSTDEDLSSSFSGMNHQLTILPDETVAFYAYGSNGCEDIKEYSPATKSTKTIINSGTAQGGASACHVNNIQYSKVDDTLVFSDLDNQSITKVTRGSNSKAVWTINGSHATITGVSWKGSQHGIHLLGLDDSGLDHIMLFNNNMSSASGSGDGSVALEIKLDLTAKTSTKVWSFKGAKNLQNDVMGDLQRLPNGNTVMAYSTKGVVQEVDSSGTVLTDWSFALGAEFGYIEKRLTLYGPPPR